MKATRKGFDHRSIHVTRLLSGIALAAIIVSGCSGVSLKSKSSTTSGIPDKAKLGQLFNQGLADQKGGRLESAREIYLEILKLDPLNEYAYYDLGVVYQAAGQPSAAASAYEKSLIINANYQPALFNLAVIDTADAPNTAAVLYQRLEQLNPRNASAYFNLGLLFVHTGATSAGDMQLARAVELDPALLSRIPAKLVPPSLRTQAASGAP